ncbi:enterobactin transporter EntS [Rhodococcus jostii]|uniref:Multidrug efflux pump Tap n=2 Tax=Rhodococcus jostii TaxID=132919 RepID=A0A1H5GFH5_RHOJO|nr:enterobactin transporter EntS [Rhodococcus jostii]SEE13918.1 MFS transporter, ENTS family, enterobactin (siderophore) exporter [Rhodococcus jostii]
MAGLSRYAIDLTPLRTSREFRYIFIARTISIFGLGLLLVAVPLQVYDMTNSTLAVGAASIVVGSSVFIGTLFGGVIADRYDRRPVISLARAAAGVAFAILAVNAFLPTPQLWVIYLCGVIEGLAGGISSTALMAVIPSLLPKDKMAAAGALMTVMADLGTVASPAIGGVIIAATSVGTNYVLAAVSSGITAYCIAQLPSLPPPVKNTESPLRSIASGFTYAAKDSVVGGTLLVGFCAMMLTGWNVLLPAYASQVLHAGPAATGLLYSAPAVGALTGSLTSGWTGTARRGGLVVFLAAMIASAGLVGVGAVPMIAVTFLGLAAHGFGRVLGDILRYAVIQTETPEEYRGRVAGVWGAQISTGSAAGALVAGAVGAAVGPREAFLLYGAGGIVVLAVLALTLKGLRTYSSAAAEEDDLSAAAQ